MTMRPATPAEIDDWNRLVHEAPAGYSFLQDLPFGEVKAPGWEPRPMIHELDGVEVPVLYLVRRWPFFGESWYAPSGPRVVTEEHVREICADLQRQATKAFEIVMEPMIPVTGPETREHLIATIPNLRQAPDIQPTSHTVIIDLTRSEEELLASFRQRTRRYLRKSSAAVVEHIEDESAFEPFWRLYTTMVDRAGVAQRPKEYYEKFWRTYLALGQGHFVLARPAEGEDYAAGAFLIHDKEASYYKDGGSVRSREANGLQYLVQWECMRWCKQQGATTYDMLGTPASWKADDESEHLHSLVQFKTGYAPIVDHVGGINLVRMPRMKEAWERTGRRAFNLMARRTHAQYY